MDWIEFMGCLAGVLTSFAFFPQIIKLIRTKQAIGISISTYSCTFIGCSIWFVYGLLMNSIALVIFNLINIITTFIIVILSNRYR